MKLTDHLFQISGVQYETNSNIYAIRHKEGIVLIDCGFQREQWERMAACMEQWEMKLSDITHVFLTHSHFDHAGNVWRVNKLGAKVCASEYDAGKIENGNPEMEKLFGSSWICGKVDQILKDGDRFLFPGDICFTVLETPGHNPGSLSYLIEVDGKRVLCTGDMFFVTPCPPEDKNSVELGYMGSSDFNLTDYRKSLERLSGLDVGMLLPGHYYFYKGERAQELIREAFQKVKELRGRDG